MKSILFIAFLAIATIGCDTPESTSVNDMSAPPPMSSDSATMDSTMTGGDPVDPGNPTMQNADTVANMPADTTSNMPSDTSVVR